MVEKHLNAIPDAYMRDVQRQVMTDGMGSPRFVRAVNEFDKLIGESPNIPQYIIVEFNTKFPYKKNKTELDLWEKTYIIKRLPNHKKLNAREVLAWKPKRGGLVVNRSRYYR